jgi:hypothetical protein
MQIKKMKCRQKPQHNRSWHTRTDHDDLNENQDSRSQGPIGAHIKTRTQSRAHQNRSQQPRNNKGRSNRESRDQDRSQQPESRSLHTKTDRNIQAADQGRLQQQQNRTEHIEADCDEAAPSKINSTSEIQQPYLATRQ